MIEVKQYVVNEFKTNEAMKALRTNLLFSGEKIQAVALTSFQPNEGKSTIAFQLCASLAESGKKTLLIDADLRNSVLVNSLKVREQVNGLSHFLSGVSDIKDLIKVTDFENFHILFAGVRVPNSAELLGGERFKQLMKVLRTRYDVIIVDTAPLGLVIDTAIVAPIVDGTVIVIDATNNSYKQERRILAQLERTKGRILGVILNRIDDKTKSQYGYGYEYGYGENKD